jgi:hypothetical protein
MPGCLRSFLYGTVFSLYFLLTGIDKPVQNGESPNAIGCWEL